ncbi:CI-B8 domain-containing protein [Phaeosphaeria sp. MPI-PUGE-AT-0046c]|nr:CI-B8 domain-containing protein [Phaeosphaeria sp. MPI-PUGE-AT-0046c]
MVNIVTRTRRLKEKLLWIRNGPGALLLPKEVSKISMEFNFKLDGGHRGARKFWREMLPRMKFRNPSIPMTISRHTDPDGPSLLHIYTTSNTPSTTSSNPSAPPSATPNPQTTLVPDTSEPTHTINIRGMQDSKILAALLRTVPGIKELQPSAEEEEEMAEMRALREQGERDRVMVKERLTKERREEELLKIARGEIPDAA